jgi:hypothetical protein
MPVMFTGMPEKSRNLADFLHIHLRPRNRDATMILDILKGCLQNRD